LLILGIDPGSLATGWGLVDADGATARFVACGVLRPGPSGVPFARRLSRLRLELEQLVDARRPDCAAVESPFHGANARSALQLAHARGVALAVLDAAGLDVAEYSPATIKKAVTANGRADKEQVRRMVERLLGTGTHEGGTDLSDALAVALCHAAAFRLHRVARSLGVRGSTP
jgi:crossover junction endodeoxyribonuclease RuvC